MNDDSSTPIRLVKTEVTRSEQRPAVLPPVNYRPPSAVLSSLLEPIRHKQIFPHRDERTRFEMLPHPKNVEFEHRIYTWWPITCQPSSQSFFLNLSTSLYWPFSLGSRGASALRGREAPRRMTDFSLPRAGGKSAFLMTVGPESTPTSRFSRSNSALNDEGRRCRSRSNISVPTGIGVAGIKSQRFFKMAQGFVETTLSC